MLLANHLARWAVTTTDGTVITVWADSYSEDGGEIVFAALADASAQEQEELDVVGRTPSNPARVVVALARFPATAVVTVWSS